MDEFPGEDERVHLMIAKDECAHEYVTPVCVECGIAMPAPHPGYAYDTQNWDAWIA